MLAVGRAALSASCALRAALASKASPMSDDINFTMGMIRFVS